MDFSRQTAVLICGFSVVIALSTSAGLFAADEAPGIDVPDGFKVELYADDDLAHDIHSMTIDAQGRVVVSGPGFVRILIDSNNDGRADTFKTFSEQPKTGSQGMFFLGSSLLCSGDEGVQIFRDDNRDDVADGPPQVFMKIEAGGEHHVHSIQKGPDGWWYIIAGNFSGVTKAYATVPTSPISNPTSGTLLRLKPDLSAGEIVSDGFRNAYDFCFNAQGDFFTYDSDDERDISLPWYLPTQVFHVLPASNAGYVTAGLKRPGSYPDMPPVLATFGRGSPTGVICYQHEQFPEEYRGALFVQDWTIGRILAVKLSQDGAGWTGTPLEFARGRNQFGFAPTDMEVAPDGSLFVSVGGRGTRGSVFRISHNSGPKAPAMVAANAPEQDRLNAILKAPQPNTSWSRSGWLPLCKPLGVEKFRSAAMDENRRVAERVRAVEILVEVFGGLDSATASSLASAGSPLVRARAAWAVGRSKPDAPDPEVLRKFLADRSPIVRRFALESLTSATSPTVWSKVLNELAQSLATDDRVVRLTAAQLLGRLSDIQRDAIQKALLEHKQGLLWFSLGSMLRKTTLSPSSAQVAMEIVADAAQPLELRRDAVRVLQMALSDVGPGQDRPVMFDGYAPRASMETIERDLNPIFAKLTDTFPSGDAALDHELIRVIAMTSPPNRDLFTKLLAGITESSLPSDDIHRLAAIARMNLERSYEESTATAKALVGIDVKIRKLQLKQDTNWDDRIGELYAALCEVDPAMPTVLTEQPGFGQPGHALFLSKVPQGTVSKAIDGFVATIAADPDFTWTNDVVFAIGESDKPEHLQLLRSQLANLSVRDAVLMELADAPLKDDRALFVSGLESAQLNAVEACLKALTKLPRSNEAAEQFALLAAARRLMNDAREFGLREMAMRLLQNNTGQTLKFVFGTEGHKPQPEAMQAWQEWLTQRYPDYKPMNADEAAKAILVSLNEVSWEQGDIERGRKLFERLSCAKCHGGRRALGPDLTGVAKRFSRDDLFAAIVDPNRDISPRYQTTSIETKTGKVFTGLIVYESIDGLLLRDAEHKTYRIEGEDIESKHLQRNSLMPNGLLKEVKKEEIADLNAYLQSL